MVKEAKAADNIGLMPTVERASSAGMRTKLPSQNGSL
jgi:hypothetical protein